MAVEMWHGAAIRMYAGSIVCLVDLEDGSKYADEMCKVIRFDAVKKKWLVRLVHERFGGRQLLVKEENACFVYCLLPSSLCANSFDRVKECAAQCGRGLFTLNPAAKGDVLLEERPFFLSAAGVEAAWKARWFGFLQLELDSEGDKRAKNALEVFNSLSSHCRWPRGYGTVREAAVSVAESCGYREALGNTPELDEAADKISNVLLRVKANQFDFADGSLNSSSALYAKSSLMNHSCEPTARARSHWGLLNTGCSSDCDGRMVVRATRMLEPGEEICLNYGPDELLDWPVERRNQYLSDELGFTCLCLRCKRESGEASLSPVPGPAPSFLSEMD